MAFSSIIKGRATMGELEVTWGTFDGDSVTTGEIDLGLRYLQHADFLSLASAVGNDVVMNETVPGPGDSSTGLYTIIFDSGEAGTWMAWAPTSRARKIRCGELCVTRMIGVTSQFSAARTMSSDMVVSTGPCSMSMTTKSKPIRDTISVSLGDGT